MTTKLLFLDNDGVIAEVANGVISNIGGTSSPSFTVAGTPVMLADGRAADGSNPSWMNLQFVYDNSVASDGATRIVMAPGKDLDIGSNLSSYVRVDAETGKVTITGDLDVKGGMVKVDAIIQDADHWVISPDNPNIVALRIEPDEGVLPQTDLVAISNIFEGDAVFRIDSEGNVYVVGDISVTGTVDGVDVAALRSTVISHLQAGSTKHSASDIALSPVSQLPNAATVQDGIQQISDQYALLTAELTEIKIDRGIVLHEHIQNVASTSWTITHGGDTTRVFPAAAYDTEFNEMEYTNFEVLSNNQVRVTFATPRIGRFDTGVLDAAGSVDLGNPTVTLPNVLTNLSELLDTDIQTPTDGQLLAFSNGFWRPIDVSATAVSLSDLQDVSVDTAVAGDVLTKTSTGWVAASPSQSLDNLSDVEITAPAQDDVVVYDNGVFKNKALNIPTTLSALEDVDVVSSSDGDVLTREGSVWRSVTPSIQGQSDALITEPVNGDLLSYSNGKWSNIPNQYTTISGMTDVTFNNLVVGHVLVSTATGWENFELPPYVREVNDLSDIFVSAPTTGQTLTWDGIRWTNNDSLQSIDELVDVDLTGISQGKTITWNNGKFVPTSLPSIPAIPSVLNDFTDVVVPTPTDGDVIAWNATSGKWENKDLGVMSSIADLNDLQITTPSDGQILVYRNNKWVNETQSAAETLSLNDLSNVSAPSAIAGQFLRYTGTVWAPATYSFTMPSISLATLTDIALSTPSEGHILMYNGTDWANVLPQDAGLIPDIPTTLDDLLDVSITDPTVGDYLRFNGSGFVAAPADSINLALNNLNNVSTSPSDGHYLKYNGSGWVSAAFPEIPQSIATMPDVLLSEPVEGQQLVFHLGAWTNRTPQGIPQVLSDLDDVDATPPTLNQVLVYNGTQYVPTSLADGITSLSGVGDVQFEDVSTGDVLMYLNNKWVNTNQFSSVLFDTQLAMLADGDMLVRSAGKWVNVRKNQVLSFSDLSDTANLSPGALQLDSNGLSTYTPLSNADLQEVLNLWISTDYSIFSIPGVSIDQLNMATGSVLTLQSDGTLSLALPSDTWADLNASLAPNEGEVLTYSTVAGWGTAPIPSLPSPSASGFLYATVDGTSVSQTYVVPALTDLSNVSATTPSDGQLLGYDSTLSQWVPQTPSVNTSLSSLSDVSIASPSTGSLLSYNGSAWVPVAPSIGGSTFSIIA